MYAKGSEIDCGLIPHIRMVERGSSVVSFPAVFFQSAKNAWQLHRILLPRAHISTGESGLIPRPRSRRCGLGTRLARTSTQLDYPSFLSGPLVDYEPCNHPEKRPLSMLT